MENNKNTTFENQGAQSKFVDKRMSNVKSDLIEITHDKLENILLKHLKSLDIRNSWITPASIFLTVLIARLTSTFNDSLGIPKDVWNAFFLIVMIGSGIWLIWKIVEIISCWKKSSVEYLINSIKASEKGK
ncbi:hypothetical protein [Tenacibaculum finnmarkense]|uniref:hypothetical protein n=1 Tax=Tenacibaculum finnmarkense TaxID=2781243 RepID=UPI000C47497D|nr:hypothetical protein [Tenacibaculum finnmarkense]MCD8440634.1 hypothetical protein [Tenacibaculum finnmarkense genomovar ulcerans]MCG8721477.1 hypothetical protein [Tenacibaculum finnmarkense]SOS55344.1 conserved hypothetical protein [Tenacibaculum finnmarkense]